MSFRVGAAIGGLVWPVWRSTGGRSADTPGSGVDMASLQREVDAMSERNSIRRDAFIRQQLPVSEPTDTTSKPTDTTPAASKSVSASSEKQA